MKQDSVNSASEIDCDNSKNIYYIIDIIKFVFCLFVIGLHADLLTELNPNIYYYFEKGLLRLAVPFFMVTSGFLLAKKYSKNKTKQSFINYSKRLLKLLIFFEVIGMTMNFCTQFFIDKNSVSQILLGFLRSAIFYPFNALWYLQAILIGSWITYFFVKRNKVNLGLLIGFMLYLFALLCNSYYFFVDGSQIIDNYLRICISARNGVFVGFFFVTLGYKVYEISLKSNRNTFSSFLVLAIIYFIYILEIYLIKNKISVDDKSLFITTPLIAASLLYVASKFRTEKTNTIILRNLSTGMYLIHRPLLSTIMFIFSSIIHISIRGTLLYLIVVIASMAICLISYRFNLKISSFLK